jgi:allophanate hydrolase subunit 2
MLSGPVVPGVVQVPRSGDPILLSADAQTTGGYPQVAVVCTADLGRAGRLRPGDEVRFAVVTVAEAHAFGREHEAALAAQLARARPAPPPPDLSALHEANLVSGVVDGVVDAADG